jgi:hypothetical protein
MLDPNLVDVAVLPVVGAPVADLVDRMRLLGLRVVVDDRPERIAVRLRDARARYVVLVRNDGVVVHSPEGRRQVSADDCVRLVS